jgi:hypothetical protein
MMLTRRGVVRRVVSPLLSAPCSLSPLTYVSPLALASTTCAVHPLATCTCAIASTPCRCEPPLPPTCAAPAPADRARLRPTRTLGCATLHRVDSFLLRCSNVLPRCDEYAESADGDVVNGEYADVVYGFSCSSPYRVDSAGFSNAYVFTTRSDVCIVAAGDFDVASSL